MIWLLGFYWDGIYCSERALSFDLRTAPMLFNIFEAFHWILLRLLRCQRLHYYLDDFIFILGLHEAASLHQLVAGYQSLTDFLGIPRKDPKDSYDTVISILRIEVVRIEVVTAKMEARLLSEKVAKVHKLTWLTSFCTRVVRLCRTFTQSIFLFIAKHSANFRQLR